MCHQLKKEYLLTDLKLSLKLNNQFEDQGDLKNSAKNLNKE